MALPPPPIDARTEALFAAVRANDLARVEAALAAGADINGEERHTIVIDRTQYEGTNTPLALAIRRGHAEIVRRLLAVPGIEVDRGSRFSGETPLMIAARQGDTEIVEWLLAAGADPSAEDKYELCVAANFAIRGSHEAMAVRLIEAGTDLTRFGHGLIRDAMNFRLQSVVDLITARGLPTLTRKEWKRRQRERQS